METVTRSLKRLLAWGACALWFLLLLALAVVVDTWWVWPLIVTAGFIPISILIKGIWYKTIRECREMIANWSRSSKEQEHQPRSVGIVETLLLIIAGIGFFIAIQSLIEGIKTSDDLIEIAILTAFVTLGLGCMIIMAFKRALGQKGANLAGIATMVIIPITVVISKLI